MKLISLIKVYVKLQLNLSRQIKSIFFLKLNNISKCLTKKKKTHNITHNKIKAETTLGGIK